MVKLVDNVWMFMRRVGYFVWRMVLSRLVAETSDLMVIGEGIGLVGMWCMMIRGSHIGVWRLCVSLARICLIACWCWYLCCCSLVLLLLSLWCVVLCCVDIVDVCGVLLFLWFYLLSVWLCEPEFVLALIEMLSIVFLYGFLWFRS